MAVQYQLVLQFALAPRDVARFDRITDFEARLAPGGETYTLDGSDCKLGHMEVRLNTNDPPRTLEVIRGMIPASCPYEVVERATEQDR